MIYAPPRPANTVRLTRTAHHRPDTHTGIGVTLQLYPASHMRKTPERLLQIAALALDMAPSCYLMKTRTRNVAELRYIGALLLRSHFPKVTLNEIAAFFGGMDHSSIMSGMCRANKLICTGDDRFLKKYNKALNSVNIWLRKEAA